MRFAFLLFLGWDVGLSSHFFKTEMRCWEVSQLLKNYRLSHVFFVFAKQFSKIFPNCLYIYGLWRIFTSSLQLQVNCCVNYFHDTTKSSVRFRHFLVSEVFFCSFPFFFLHLHSPCITFFFKNDFMIWCCFLTVVNCWLIWHFQVILRKKCCPFYSTLPVSLYIFCVGISMFNVYLVTFLKIFYFPVVCSQTHPESTVMYSFPVWLDDHLCSCILYQRVKQVSRRLICSVATEDLSKQVEESKMDMPREIFLKDYKRPDYYFDTVSLQEFLDYVSFTLLGILKFGRFLSSCVAWNYYRCIWNFPWERRGQLLVLKLLCFLALKVDYYGSFLDLVTC